MSFQPRLLPHAAKQLGKLPTERRDYVAKEIVRLCGDPEGLTNDWKLLHRIFKTSRPFGLHRVLFEIYFTIDNHEVVISAIIPEDLPGPH